MQEELTMLYRPIGHQELDLIRENGFREFPRRLPSQPIFYPVLFEEYAVQIARDWNAKQNNPKVGYVTRFQVKTRYLVNFEVHTVGSKIHQEYWIPAEELPIFNAHIVGVIEVIGEYRGI
jgi:hypothetical protein